MGSVGHRCYSLVGVDKMTTSLTRDELLVILIEECGEVIQAATKIQRFGWDTEGPDGYGVNHEKLAHEIGDLLGIVDELGLDASIMNYARGAKAAKAEKAKDYYSRELPDGW